MPIGKYIRTAKHGENISKSLKLHGSKKGEKNAQWRGGRVRRPDGYILVHLPTHPHANVYGYIREHRLVMERYLRRALLQSEVVHHINGNNQDNRIENLMLFSRAGDHIIHHGKQRKKMEKTKT